MILRRTCNIFTWINFYFCNINFTDTIHFSSSFLQRHYCGAFCNSRIYSLGRLIRPVELSLSEDGAFERGEGAEGSGSEKILRLKRLENCPNGRAA